MNTTLPKALKLSDEVSYPIRWDYRAVLDLFEALNDPDTTPQERGLYLLTILYKDFETIPAGLWVDAVQKGLWFLNWLVVSLDFSLEAPVVPLMEP